MLYNGRKHTHAHTHFQSPPLVHWWHLYPNMPVGTAKFHAEDTAEVKELLKETYICMFVFYLQHFQHVFVFLTWNEVLWGDSDMRTLQVLCLCLSNITAGTSMALVVKCSSLGKMCQTVNIFTNQHRSRVKMEKCIFIYIIIYNYIIIY